MSDPYKNQVGPPQMGFAPPVSSHVPPYPSAPPAYPDAPPGYTEATSYPSSNPGYPSSNPGYPPPAGGNAPGPGFFAATAAAARSSAMYGAQDDARPLHDEDATGAFAFSEKTIRMAFIRKVYGILTVQLAVTIAIISMFFFWEGLKMYTRQNIWLFYVAFAVTIVCIISLACCPGMRRSFPLNFIFLGIFTVCEGFLLGVCASRYDSVSVLMAAGICAVVVLALTIFAFQTKIDFTMCGGMLFVAVIILMCFGFAMIFWRNPIAHLVYACLGALIFSMYIVFDTQMMLGGKHKYSISPEEHIFAALNLYLDIVQLFMFILSIVGSARGE